MTSLTHDIKAMPSRGLQGIFCVEIGMLFFVVQDSMMKSMLATYSVWNLVFIRSLVAVLFLTPLILFLGGQHRIFTPLWPLHLARALLITAGFSLFYTAFPFMGLAEVTTIFFAAPLITGLLAVVFLRETIGPHRIGALIAGFAGVVIAMNPTSAEFNWVVILPLICAFFYAISQIIARQIGDRESSLTVGLHMLGYSGLMILPIGWLINQSMDFGPGFGHLIWQSPTGMEKDLWLLALLGLSGMAGHILVARAYQVANASLVAPFDYSYLPLATALAYFLWAEVPPPSTLIGMGLITASGLYLGYRELSATRRTEQNPIIAESIYAPGHTVPPPPTDAEPNGNDPPA